MKKKNIIISILLTLIAGGYTYLVKTYDVKMIGPNGSKVGFASLNQWYRSLVNTHMDIYKITEILGLLIFVIVGIYGVTGIIQLVKRKSLLKVDREIIALGILYVMMILTYLVFEKVIINYRPVLIDNELEASYPSSHTLLAICTCISSIIVSRKYLKNGLYNITTFITVLLLTLVFVGRTVSSVHWISDIIGGVLISITLLSYFYMFLDKKNEKKSNLN